MSDTRRHESGAALIMALMLLAVLGTMSTLMFERSHLLTESSLAERARLRAFYAAEGGLAHARHQLSRDPEHRGDTLQISGCDVKTSVSEVASVVRRWRVRAEALSPSPGHMPVRCTLEIVLRPSPTHALPVVESWVER